MNSTYFKNLIMDNLWKTDGAAGALPSNLYIGYSMSAPAADGTNISEPASSTGYARKSLSGKLGAAIDGVVTNKEDIRMPKTTQDQGTATHLVVFDAERDGNFLCSSELEFSRIMQNKSMLIIEVGEFKVQLLDKES